MSLKSWLAMVTLAGLAGAGLAAIRVSLVSAAAAPRTAANRPASAATRPTTTSRTTWPDARLVASCGARLDALRRDTHGTLRYRLDVPFVVAGDLPTDELDRIVRHTIQPAANALWRQFFDTRPSAPITILLFAGKPSYERYAAELFGDRTVPHFGYYRSGERTLVMNIGTGTGTLVHEMVHALAASDFPRMPDWFSEGLASLYEQCTLGGGEIRGLVNWRLPDLQEAIAKGTLRPLKELMTDNDFRGPQEGLNYAQARYFYMYMQEKGLLRSFYRRFRGGVTTDPTGVQFVRDVFEGQSLEDIERDYLRWVSGLRWQ